jgi:hypothetical protein
VNYDDIDDKFDLPKMIIKPLYFGMGVNVLAPMAILLVCFYLNQHVYMPNRVGTMANTLFWLFGVMALSEAGLALWWRFRLMRKPMVRRQETMEEDIRAELLRRSRPVFVMIASISLWGYLYFFLAGRFEESVFFVLFSFIVFQVVRPRYGYVRQLIRRQREMLERHELLSD